MATQKSTAIQNSNEISNDSEINPQDVIANSLSSLDEKWAANFVRYAYGVTPNDFFYSTKLAKYRGIDLGIVDSKELKKYFEPNPNIPEEKRADLMRADWRPCPLIHALNQIIQKNIESMPIELRVSGSDKVSVDKKATQKLRIKIRRYFLDIVNFIKQMTNDEPYPEDANIDQIGQGDKMVDDSLSLIDSIKNEATTDWDFNALNEAGALKDGVEISHEEMIAYYFKSTEFKENLSPKIISDFMKINAFMYRFYTSAVNGLPMVQYLDPAYVKTSNFYKKNASDMDFWYYTETVTWATYMQMVGGKLSPEKNKMIYQKNKTMLFPNSRYPEYPENYENYSSYSFALLNTYIQIGYFEAKKHVYNPDTKTYYDVIKKFYYLPLTLSELTSDFILDLGDLQDTYRYGNNLQNADFSLIVYRDAERQSFYDVQQGDFLRMNIIYNQHLNTLANFMPEGVAFAEETIRELAEEIKAEQEDFMREKGQDITSLSLQKITEEIIRNYVLTGRGVFKLRTGDNNEQRLDRPTFIMENKILFDLEGLIKQLFQIYNTMLISLGVNQNRLGQDPKQHQTLTGIEMATTSSYFSTQNLEDAYSLAVKGFGGRMLYYDQQVITEFDSKGEPTTERAKEMKALIGVKGTVWLEVYKDMPYQRCILNIQNSPSDKDRLQLMALCAQYEQQKLVPAGTLLMAQEIPNFKLAKLYVVFAMRRQDRINVDNAQKMMEMQGQQQQQAFVQQQQSIAQAKEHDASLEARVIALENELKTKGQIEVKDKTNQNRLQENQQKADLNIQEENAKKQMETF